MQIYAKSQENIEMKKSRNPHKCVVSRLLTESDRRDSNPRSRPWQGNDKSISIVFPCFYVYFIVSISIIYLYST